MKIVFIGTVDFSYHTLRSLISAEAEIAGVITKKQSKFNSDFKDLSQLCIKHDIDYKYVKNINHEKNIEWIASKEPDVIFCLGWSQILGTEVLKVPRHGVIGYHPAKLPNNRGRHPLIWALVLGLSETASTFFIMDEGADTGDIVSQKQILISENDNAKILYDKIVKAGCGQVVEILENLKEGKLVRSPQDKEIGNYWRKRNEDDGRIDWRMSAKNINNLIKGLTRPYIGAHFLFNGLQVTVWESEVIKNDEQNIEPGKVLSTLPLGFIVKCGDHSILIKSHEPQVNMLEGDYL